METTPPFAEVSDTNSINLSNIGRSILYKMKGDMNFVGIFSIVVGVINCLTIFGAIIGIPVLIAGMRLKDAAGNFDHYLNSNSLAYFELALEKQRSYFFIMKVMIIILLAILVIEIVAVIAFFSYFMQFFQTEMTRSV